MSLRFHRSIKILPGVHLNLSKSGISLSLGGAPLTFNFGKRGSRVTTSVPGSGLSWSKRLDGAEARRETKKRG